MARSAQLDLVSCVQVITASPVSVIALFLFIACLTLNTKFDFVDDSYYIVLARSLGSGSGFSDIYLPEPHFHQHFPPGLPLFLAGPSLLGLDLSTSVILYKLLLIGCGALGLYFLARFASDEGYSPGPVAAAILIASVSITVIGYAVRVASELLYVPLSIAALMTLGKYERSSHKSRYLWISAILLVATILTRSIGVTMLAATVLSWSFRREFKRVALVLTCTALVWLPWLLLSKTASTGVVSYSKEFLSFYRSDVPLNLIYRILENAWLIVNRDIPRIILSFTASEFVGATPWLSALLLPVRLGISALVIFPIVRDLRPRPRIATLYVVCYSLPVLAWQWDPSRYTVALVPLICLWFIAGLEMLSTRLTAGRVSLSGWRHRIITAVVAICIASHLISDARFILTVRRTGHYTAEAASIWNETMAAYDWIRQHTPQAAIIGCEPAVHPHVYLFTDRKSVPLPRSPETYGHLGVTHIIHITDPTMYQGKEVKRRPDLQEFIERATGRISLTLTYQSTHISIFEIN